MSGTGKSTALQVLGERGHCVVDTDADEWSHWVTLPDGSTDWVWPADIILARIAARNNNPYGKKPEDRDLILEHLAVIEPRLRATATIEIDASAPILQVVDQLEQLIP